MFSLSALQERRLQAYIELSRFDKPVGAWLVLFPALWGLTLAHQGMPPLPDILLFTVGAFLIRGAGCTINDLLDRNLDPYVERTKNRPLARGALTIGEGIAYFIGQLTAASILLFFMPVEVFYLALGAVALMFFYPLLKRVTYWPQLFLGLCMNYSMLMAYAYVTKGLDFSSDVLVLYVGSVFWTLAYDTIYAHQDRKDDIKVGIKSSALSIFGESKFFLALCYSLFLAALAFSIVQRKDLSLLHLGFLTGLLTFPAILLFYQLVLTDFHTPKKCLQAFKLNQGVGLVVLVVLLIVFRGA
ncbi:MAG: 4-hydroxybenzoate polyprenyltransferase [Alphaproteobacteria bacterium]|nr:4-hydroxybenzoate polyprenyltransferase [Alphaproteobacteria bacterium]NCQ67213.1 4-hydroxybenzoate polyprenyltransferase [Alphaproteobacteria bacterium]NCT07057.1 4-hydroxybenzoate polyprenyltransferase [Alphaproteobacteria bacterium]